MTDQRLTLHSKLVEILGTPNVYFQPPSDFKMKYPCIVYERDKMHDARANNRLYQLKQGYQVTLISSDPDNQDKIQKILELPYSSFSRHFTTSGYNHDAFSIYH